MTTNNKVLPLFKRVEIRSTEKFIKSIEEEINNYKNRKKK